MEPHELQESLFNVLSGQYGEILETLAMWQCITALDVKPYQMNNLWHFFYENGIGVSVHGCGETIFEAAWDFYTKIKKEKIGVI